MGVKEEIRMFRTKEGEVTSDKKLMAELLNDQFHSVFNKETNDNMPFFPLLKNLDKLNLENYNLKNLENNNLKYNVESLHSRIKSDARNNLTINKIVELFRLEQIPWTN
ncbi:hypothetical protein BpHYR1_054278 [Brachionus plicatilis]|uniref:RNA-directed DNA polymerase from mobile element jockey-like n=1 Tax=Brachionus plicatilis TaxID=10195 RepID=A0A3M7S4N7_BRAPC|nr:hypothetical protein BpHYR1_054278 [Brachionus plicatilis]